jgi:hypothetical protein
MLKTLARYEVGDQDDGDGYRCGYEEVRRDGQWVRHEDVAQIVEWIEKQGGGNE